MSTKKIIIFAVLFMVIGFSLSGFILPDEVDSEGFSSDLDKITANQKLLEEKIIALETALEELKEQKVAQEPEALFADEKVLVAYVKDEYTAVNTRTDAGTGFPVVERISQKSPMVVLETKDDWYRVKLESGNIAWVASWVVRTQEE